MEAKVARNGELRNLIGAGDLGPTFVPFDRTAGVLDGRQPVAGRGPRYGGCRATTVT